jgi:hypothetical protein
MNGWTDRITIRRRHTRGNGDVSLRADFWIGSIEVTLVERWGGRECVMQRSKFSFPNCGASFAA